MAAARLFFKEAAIVVKGHRTVSVRQRVVGAVSWGIILAAAGVVLAMAVGAYATRLDGHGLGFLGAIAAPFGFAPGVWMGWKFAHRPWIFWTGLALVAAGIAAANLWKIYG